MLLNTKLEAKIGDFGLARNEEYKAAAVSVCLDELFYELLFSTRFSLSDGRRLRFYTAKCFH